MDIFNVREFSRKYSNTYVQITDKLCKGLSTVYIEDVFSSNEGKALANLSVYSENGNNNFTAEVKTFSVKALPNKKVFDYLGNTYVFFRSPNRQWRRGLCPDNSYFVKPFFDILKDFSNPDIKMSLGKGTSINLPMVHALFNPKYNSSFLSCIDKLYQEETRAFSLAISDEMWVAIDPVSKDSFILFRYDNPIATYNNKSNKFKLLDQIYLQEVTDFCNRQHLNSIIEV